CSISPFYSSPCNLNLQIFFKKFKKIKLQSNKLVDLYKPPKEWTFVPKFLLHLINKTPHNYSLHKKRRFYLDHSLSNEYRLAYEVNHPLFLSKIHPPLSYKQSNNVENHEPLKHSLKRKRFDHLGFLDVGPYCTDRDVLPILHSYTAKLFLHLHFQHRHVRYLMLHLHWPHTIVPELSDELIRCAH